MSLKLGEEVDKQAQNIGKPFVALNFFFPSKFLEVYSNYKAHTALDILYSYKLCLWVTVICGKRQIYTGLA